jgi:Fe-S cluster assembly iron-binding protein IscA
MALDEPQENDATFTDQGITFVIEKALFNQVKPINIDFIESPEGSGFALTSSLSKNGGCSSEGGGCC